MDTKSFLQKILPASGYLLLGKWWQYPEPKNGVTGTTIYRPFGPEQFDEMADEAIRQSNAGENVYFACSSFNEITYLSDWKGKDTGREHPKWWGKAGRLQSNVKQCKAFWLDLDVGKADTAKSYNTQREAALSVAALVKATGLPMPMIVSSGNGLHCYWTLTKSIPADQWKRVARVLASICDHVGVKHDSSCTSDESRILRPVGTVNPKGGKRVTLMRDMEPMSPGAFARAVLAYMEAHDLRPTKALPPKLGTKAGGLAASVLAGVDHAPSYPEIVAEHCLATGHFVDVGGDVAEPYWWKIIGMLKFCVDGEKFAHQWSSGSDKYDPDVTQKKLDDWTAGPPSCETIKPLTGGICDKCAKKCKYPHHLGKKVSEPETQPVPQLINSTTAPTALTIPFRPAGFRWTGKAMVQEVPDKDGVIHDVVFCDSLFYATNRVRNAEGEWSLIIRMSVGGHEWREFELPTTLVADPRGFAKHMAKYELLIFNVEPARLYTKELVNMLVQHQQKTVTYDRFGWDEGRFIVGRTSFMPDGTTAEVMVGKNIVNAQRNISCAPKGSLAAWVDMIDTTYNRPGAEMYQFVIATYGFAAPLVSLLDFKNFRGVPLVLSGEGGIGKSSIFKAANTIYADPNAFLVDASAKGGATLNALLGMASLFNGVPLLFDEMTQRDNDDFTPLMYSLSNGVPKIRMTSNGKFAENVAPFASIYGGTSNTPITDKIYEEEKRDTADAASARCFEIGGLTKQHMIDLFGQLDIGLIDRLSEHHGVAAQVYLPYVIQNRDSVRNLVIKMREKLGCDPSVESRERYYIDLIAFGHVAGLIAQKLGLIKWDVTAMTKWAIRHMQSLRRNFAERSALTSDVSGQFLSWLHGNIVTTKYFPSSKNKTSHDVEIPQDNLRGKPLARIALVDRRMLVSVSALQAWCKEFKQDYTQVRNQLRNDNYILTDRLEYIGKGTPVHAGRARCFEFNYDKVVGSLHVVRDIPSSDESSAAVTDAVT